MGVGVGRDGLIVRSLEKKMFASQTPGNPQWKGRTNPTKVSSELHTHTVACMYPKLPDHNKEFLKVAAWAGSVAQSVAWARASQR